MWIPDVREGEQEECLKYLEGPTKSLGWGSGLGKHIKVSHCGLLWSPRTLTFHVQSKNLNRLN